MEQPASKPAKLTLTDYLRAIGQNEIVSMCLLIAALMYDMFYLDLLPPATNSLSSLGRRRYLLFFWWCFFSGSALLVNVPRLYYRCGYYGKTGMRIMYVSMFFLLLTVVNMSPEPLPHRIHIVTAISFGVLAWLSILIGLFHMFHNRKYRILTAVFFILCVVDVRFLLIHKQMALYEFIPLLLAYAVLFLTNFTKEFDIPEDRIPHKLFALHVAKQHEDEPELNPNAPVKPTAVHPNTQSARTTSPPPNTVSPLGITPPLSPSQETLLAFTTGSRPSTPTRLSPNPAACPSITTTPLTTSDIKSPLPPLPELAYQLTPLQHKLSHYTGAVFLVGCFWALLRFRLGLVEL